jgi:hypothetical protein
LIWYLCISGSARVQAASLFWSFHLRQIQSFSSYFFLGLSSFRTRFPHCLIRSTSVSDFIFHWGTICWSASFFLSHWYLPQVSHRFQTDHWS